jgi:DNA polymerase
MKLQELNNEYKKLQDKYGEKELDSICSGGLEINPNICFVFMNPTGRNIASSKNWQGLKAPWIGTKNIWDLFYKLDLLDEDIYNKIKNIKGSQWTEQFADEVYNNVKKYKYYITNLGKCTQLDARELPDSVYKQYLDLFLKEIEIIKPKIIILFGNQVSTVVLNEKISVSQCRKQKFERKINDNIYTFYSLYYPVGNGRFNIDKTIEDLKWIIEKEIKNKVLI